MFGNDSRKVREIYVPAPTPARLQRPERIVMITGEHVEDLEFFYPYYRLTEEGYKVDVVTIDGGGFAGKHGIGLNDSFPITEVKLEDYALLYLPGGKAPEKLRENEDVLVFVRNFAASGKIIASICHGPQILISAGLVKGRTMAAYPEVAEEIETAGGRFADEALKIDGQFITSRVPGDLPRHLSGIISSLQRNDNDHAAPHSEQKMQPA